MGSVPGVYSPSYSVDYYDKLCKSYALRSKLVPYDKKDEFIDYLTQQVVFHGGLAGPLGTIASFFSKHIRVITGDDSVRQKVEEMDRQLGLFWTQMTAWLSVFMYSNTCIIYFPKQVIEMSCPNCKAVFAVNDSRYRYPVIIKAMDWEQDGTRRVMSSMRVGPSEKRQHPRQYGISCECPECASTISGVPTTTWVFSAPGKLMVLNPKLFTLEKNDVGHQRVIIDPTYYKGPLLLDKEIDSFHLEGVPWNLAVTYASREMVYDPDPMYYMTFSLREFAALGTAGSAVPPVLSSISDMVTMDIYKMGIEGLAFSKIDPLYVVSPVQNNNAAFDGLSQADFRDFIIQGMKAHQEGDINRVLYSPMPVDVSALFGDGKRFMSIQEIMVTQNMVLGGLGFTNEALNGSSGFSTDPVKFEAWNNVIGEFNARIIILVNNILKLSSVKYYKAVTDPEVDKRPTLWIPQLSQLNGGLNIQQKLDLVAAGRLPIEEVVEDIGLPSVRLWRQYIKASKLAEERSALELESAVTKMREAYVEQENASENGEAPNMALARQLIVEEAENTAQELSQLTPQERRSRTEALKTSDYVLYAVVIKKLETINNVQTAEAKAGNTDQGQQGGY